MTWAQISFISPRNKMEKYYDWDQQLTSPLWTAPGGQNAARGAEPTQETNLIRRT